MGKNNPIAMSDIIANKKYKFFKSLFSLTKEHISDLLFLNNVKSVAAC